MQYFCLCSGSKGNCFVLKDEGVQIIVDCGSTRRYLKEAFQKVNVDYMASSALLITHEHSDHISQIRMFAELDIYSPIALEKVKCIRIQANQTFMIGHLQITPLALSHDTPVCVGYVIRNAQEKLVYITDTGYLKSAYYKEIADADYYIMESNHDVQMLMNTSRPYLLKQRILSDSGHLSNESCAEILKRVIGEHTREIVLAPLSEEANTPALALKAAREAIPDEGISIRCAMQKEVLSGGVKCEEQ